MHAPLANDLDPLPILKQGSRVLHDNVNLMQHASDAQHRKLDGFLEASNNPKP
jgi:hypothetical protein